MGLLLYGANGYTAKIMIDDAAQFGLKPILGGRSETIKELAEEKGLEYRIFDLQNSSETEKALQGVTVVLHCAGPFRFTALQMMEACLNTGTHYLDITGEINVFELGASLNQKAIEKGIMVMPGVGFDVVPTDCLASFLKNQLPDASSLKLAFAGLGGSMSKGTTMTMVEGMGEGSKVRKNGKIESVPLGFRSMELIYNGKNLFFMTIPWGDVSTAFYTTGIPNIETYTTVSKKRYGKLGWMNAFGWLLKLDFVKEFARKKVRQGPAGPTDEVRKNSRTYIWGEVTDTEGKKLQAYYTTPNGYTVTSHTGLLIAKKVLEGSFKSGFHTPAGLYGQDLIQEIPDITPFTIIS